MLCYIMVWLMGLRFVKCSVSHVVIEDQDGLEPYLYLLTSGFALLSRRVRKYFILESWLIWAHYRDFYFRINFVKELAEGRVKKSSIIVF